jgi:hypothetical protein
MKVGDLVAPSCSWYQFVGFSAIRKIGIVIKVEKDFYTTNKDNRITVQWVHGEESCEPEMYLQLLSEAKSEKSKAQITSMSAVARKLRSSTKKK